jgi:site-specific recombinase XerD
MGKLTIQAVKAFEPPRKGQSFLWDGELRGFGVRAIPSGLKTFVLQYRNAEGRSRRIVLGRFGVLTVEQARDKAKIKLGAVADGDDPAEEAGPRETISVAEVCNWYLAEAQAGRILGRRNRPIKPSNLAMDRSRIETHIKPLIGRRQVRALKLADIAGMQADIAGGKTAKPRAAGRGGVTTGGAGVAARTVSTLQSLLAHAKLLNMITSNPAVGVRKLAGKKKERRLSVAEITRLGEAMRAAETGGERPVALAVIRLMLLTGFRISEAQGLQHHWLHADEGYVHFPDTKSDGQVRAIGPSAARLTASQPIRKECPYVFPGEVGDGHYTAAKGCLARLCAAAKIEDVTPHTLRHTFGSVAGDLGFSELTIAALLGHATRGVTQGYVHIDEALKLAASRTCEEIADLLEGHEAAARKVAA